MSKRSFLVLFLVLGLLTAVLVYLLQETRQLTGVVRDEITQSPVAGATIQIGSAGATTDDAGQYAIAVPRGKSSLSATADGYLTAHSVVDGDGLFARPFTLDLMLTPNRVTGTIRDAETNAPIPNAQILFGDRPVNANAQGNFEARGVKNGTPIIVQIPGYQPGAFGYDGQTHLDLTVLPNSATISVIDQYTNQPVAKAQIQNGDALPVDPDGRVALKRVKPGAAIRAFAPGYEARSATFTGGDLQIALRPNTLDGTVTDAATGQPISGTLVYSGTTFVSTNAKGAYHFDNVPAKAVLTFKAPGYRRTQIEVSGTITRDIKLAPFLVKAIHIPFGLPADRVRELLDMVNKTELNAIVIDVKSEKGRLAWASQVPLAQDIGAPTKRPDTIDLLEVVERCKTQNIYCIARLAVFQDTLLATARPNLAIRNLNGTTYVDNGGAAWANPYTTEVWSYNIALTKEIVALGFDEVQFDYVRFPGRVTGVSYGTDYTEDTRIAAIAGFMARAQKELRPTGAFVSADVFGLTTATDDDQGTGQRLHDLGPYVDYISPMVYPDTWVEASDLLTKGLGINCLEAVRCPYDVVYSSFKRATEKTSTKVRLWLQAYPGKLDYGVKEFRLQRKAAIDTGSVGWMFWSGTGTYDIKTFDPK